MNRHHLLHVYTGLRTEIERLASTRHADPAGVSSEALGLTVRSEIIKELSRLLWNSERKDGVADPDVH